MRWIVIICILVLFMAGGLLVENSTPFAPLKKAARSPAIPSGILNYGPLGKILKQLGKVVAVPNDPTLFSPSKKEEPGPTATLFQKKRYVGKYLWRANPGGFRDIPSSQVIDEKDFKKGWPLLSITVDEDDLYSPGRGIITNFKGQGREWERLAYVSYFEKGNLLFATAAGVRVHGGSHREAKQLHHLRLYFRDEYGANRFKPGILFGPGAEPLTRLVVREDKYFVTLLAFDIAKKIGCRVPGYKPALLKVNSQYKGVYSLTEHLNKNHWKNHMGHDNFAFYKYLGNNEQETRKNYRKLRRWVRFANKMTMNEVAKYVNIDNLARHLFSFVFLGAEDWAQGVAILDKNAAKPRWYWINWDMDNSFYDNYARFKLKKKRPIWEQEAFELVLHRKLYWWWIKEERVPPVQMRTIRFILFYRLWKEDPGFHKYFARLVMDIMNHRINPDFLKSRVDYYSEMAGEIKTKYFNEEDLRHFLKHRPGFIRKQMKHYFNTGDSLLCQVKGSPGNRYMIDGYHRRGDYRGWYFKGEKIKIEMQDSQKDELSYWLVNGKKITDGCLEYPVNTGTVIIPVVNKR